MGQAQVVGLFTWFGDAQLLWPSHCGCVGRLKEDLTTCHSAEGGDLNARIWNDSWMIFHGRKTRVLKFRSKPLVDTNIAMHPASFSQLTLNNVTPEIKSCRYMPTPLHPPPHAARATWWDQLHVAFQRVLRPSAIAGFVHRRSPWSCKRPKFPFA